MQALIRKDPANLEAPIKVLSVSRYLERIADQCTNIAEDIVFLVEGEIDAGDDGGLERHFFGVAAIVEELLIGRVCALQARLNLVLDLFAIDVLLGVQEDMP